MFKTKPYLKTRAYSCFKFIIHGSPAPLLAFNQHRQKIRFFLDYKQKCVVEKLLQHFICEHLKCKTI